METNKIVPYGYGRWFAGKVKSTGTKESWHPQSESIRMADNTKIQWCDNTVNPIMGCGGCELFPNPGEVLGAIDKSVEEVASGWKSGNAKTLYKDLIGKAYDAIDNPVSRHKRAVTTTNLWHLRDRFVEAVVARHGTEAAHGVERAIEQQITCYAAKLHLNKGLSLVNPIRKTHKGYAPTFEALARFEGRVESTPGKPDLLGRRDPDRPWMDLLPRLIFVSDMGDALSRKSDFPYLKSDVIKPIESELGRRHLWLWLTKRPQLMAEFAREIGGLPDNICAMTTVTGHDKTSLDRIDQLRNVDARVKGLSIEPLWERIPPKNLKLDGIDWVIVGGESGSGETHTRPFALEWAEELHDHCAANGVAFFLKQLGRCPTRSGKAFHLKNPHGGDWNEWPDDSLRVREFPMYFHNYRKNERVECSTLRRVTKGGLTPGEKEDFKRLDKKVNKFAKDMVHAAMALYEIRDRRLYRARHKTFSEYCEAVHQLSRHYVNRLIQAGKIGAEVVPIVTNMGLPAPENEAQLRELARLPDTESQIAVYRQACAATEMPDKAPTALQISHAITNHQGSAAEAPPQPKPLSPTQRLAGARAALKELDERLDGVELPKAATEVLERLRAALK